MIVQNNKEIRVLPLSRVIQRESFFYLSPEVSYCIAVNVRACKLSTRMSEESHVAAVFSLRRAGSYIE